MIRARIIEDSRVRDERVITFVVHCPKFINAEILTHKGFSVNASSSRALGFPSTRRQDGPFVPPYVEKPSTKMFGDGEVELDKYISFEKSILRIYDYILRELDDHKGNIHKQHLNRYVEPFFMQTLVITANKYVFDNMIKLRKSKFADPNIQILARRMEECIDKSKTKFQRFHLPYVTLQESKSFSTLDQFLISAGRLAKVSYNNLSMEDPGIAIKRAKRLIEDEHKSCFTHQLLSDKNMGYTHSDIYGNWYSGNIRGWSQFRKVIWGGLREIRSSSIGELEIKFKRGY